MAPPLVSVWGGGGSGRVEDGEGLVGKGGGSKRGRQLTTILTPVGPTNLCGKGGVVYNNTSKSGDFDTNQLWIQKQHGGYIPTGNLVYLYAVHFSFSCPQMYLQYHYTNYSLAHLLLAVMN